MSEKKLKNSRFQTSPPQLQSVLPSWKVVQKNKNPCFTRHLDALFESILQPNFINIYSQDIRKMLWEINSKTWGSLGTKTSVFDLPGVPKRPGVVVFCCCFQCFAFTDCAFTADWLRGYGRGTSSIRRPFHLDMGPHKKSPWLFFVVEKNHSLIFPPPFFQRLTWLHPFFLIYFLPQKTPNFPGFLKWAHAMSTSDPANLKPVAQEPKVLTTLERLNARVGSPRI